DALRTQLLDLGYEGVRIKDHAVADHRQLALAHHAGGQKGELVDLAVDNQRMARIVAALEANDDVGALRQPVDDLALALVAPLGADDHYIGHYSSLRSRMCRPARQTATFHASIATRSAWRDPSLPLWRAAGPTISGLR